MKLWRDDEMDNEGGICFFFICSSIFFSVSSLRPFGGMFVEGGEVEGAGESARHVVRVGFPPKNVAF